MLWNSTNGYRWGMGFDPEFVYRDCPWCGLRDAQMITRAQDVATAGHQGAPQRYWSMLSCPRCSSVILLETNAPGVHPPQIEQQFPSEAHVEVDHLPADVERFYKNSVRALDADLPDSAAVELRRTLEAAAAHFEVDSGNLVTRIKKLIDAGLITRPFGDVLDHIRKLSNVGAHAGDEHVDHDAARRAFRFTTQVLRNLFEIPSELAAMSEGEEDFPE